MVFDMNSEGTMTAEVFAFADWPFTPPGRTPVREEVALKGSSTGGTKREVQGVSDHFEPPDQRLPSN